MTLGAVHQGVQTARRRSKRGGRRTRHPQERLGEAPRRAEKKARVLRDALHYGVVVALLAIFLPPLAWVVGIFWGIGLGKDLIQHFIEPELRRRWIDKEVQRELTHSVDTERQDLAYRHSQSIEELAAGVAHEIRNPISAARSLVQQMGEDPGSATNVAYAGVALEELQRVEHSISHLLRFAREEDLVFAELCLRDVVDKALEVLRAPIAESGVAVATKLDSAPRLSGDAEKLRRVVIHLLRNALDAVSGQVSPAPRVEVATGTNLARSEAWLRVRDNGPGMDAQQLARIWSPFYTSKEEGTGLGLAISKKLVEAHGGRINASSTRGQGTELLISLPRDPRATNPPKDTR